jgi:hypothetical protein
MSKLVLSGDTSGSVTLDAPAVSGTTTLTLPTTSGTLATTSAISGGATVSTGSITLNNASTRLQVIDGASAIGTVTLPSATTFASEGSDVFLVKNFSPYTMNIVYSDGWYGNSILAGGYENSISLLDNTSAIGGWTPTNDSRLKVKPYSTISGSSIIDSTAYDIAVMTDTTVICLYSNTSADIYYSVGTISDGVISWTSPTLLLTTTAYKVWLTRLTDTTAFLLFNGVAGGDAIGTHQVYGLTLSGSTVTLSAAASISTIVLYDIERIDDTRAFLNYGTSANSVCRVVTHNGASAPTFGTAATIIAGAYMAGSIVKTMASTLVDTDKLVTFYTDPDSVNTLDAYARVSSISGTTITFGTELTLSTVDNVYCRNQQAYSTNANYAFNTDGWGVSISGTTLTSLGLVAGDFQTLSSMRNSSIALLSSNNGITRSIGRTKYSDATGMKSVANTLSSSYALEGRDIRPSPSGTFAVTANDNNVEVLCACTELIET